MAMTFVGSVQAQVRLEARLGAGATSVLATDQVGTPILRSTLGIATRPATAKLRPAPDIGLSLVMPMRAGTEALFTGSWSPTRVHVSDSTDSYDAENVSVVQTTLGLRRSFRDRIEAGAAFGATFFEGGDTGLMRGASIAPTIEGSIGTARNGGAHRLHVRAFAQLMRFDTRALDDAGGSAGNIMRYGAQVAITLKGAVQK